MMILNRSIRRCFRPAPLAVFGVLLAVPALAQNWDCVQTFNFTAAASVTTTADNRQTGCDNWILGYVSEGFTAISLRFESANGATAPGAFGAFTGTVITGANPSVNTTRSEARFTGYVGWYRVQLVSVTGTGTVRGVLYGYKAGYSAAFPGPYNPLASCPTVLATTTLSVGLTQLVAPVAGQIVTLCHISEAFSGSVDWTLFSSTGAACAGAVALTGVYRSILTVALETPFVLPVSTGLCVNLGSSVPGGGLLLYGQR
jgi:hypothetical protein